MKLRSLFTVSVISILIMTLLPAQALMAQQPSPVAYGQTVGGAISPTAPTATFMMQGSAGDLVNMRLIEFTPDQHFALTVLSPGGLPISAPDQTELSLRLGETGAFAIQIASPDGSSGEFLLQVFGTPAGAPIQAIAPGSPLAATFPGAPAIFSITADLSSSQSVVIDGSDGLLFEVVIVNNLGEIVFSVSGLPSVDVTLPPSADGVTSYEVRVSASDDSTTGAIQVSLEPETVAPPASNTGSVPPPATTPEVLPPGSGACTVTASGVVNVRQGPSTNYFIAGQLLPGVSLPVIGINQDWYAVNFNGAVGWVSSTVTTLSGDCSSVPFMSPEGIPAASTPAATTPTTITATSTQSPTTSATTQVTPTTSTSVTVTTSPTYTYTPTTATENGVLPTATYTPSMTYTATQVAPTASYTPSYTPTVPVPTAPPDANYFLTIPLDSTASVTDFVSYPDGDTEDRVFYDVTGMNNNVALPGGLAQLTLSVSCFGTGTQNITFFTGGNTYSCGQTIFNAQISAEQDTGSVLITAVAGPNTYVQWVLTGTATRLN